MYDQSCANNDQTHVTHLHTQAHHLSCIIHQTQHSNATRIHFDSNFLDAFIRAITCAFTHSHRRTNTRIDSSFEFNFRIDLLVFYFRMVSSLFLLKFRDCLTFKIQKKNKVYHDMDLLQAFVTSDDDVFK